LICMFILLLTGSNITNLLLFMSLLFIFIFQSKGQQKSMIIVCLMMMLTFFVKVSPQNNMYVVDNWRKFLNEHYYRNYSESSPVRITDRPDSTLNEEEKRQKKAQLYVDSVNMSTYENNLKKSLTPVKAMSVAGFVEKPKIPKDSIHTPKFQHRNDTSAVEKKLLQYISEESKEVPIASTRPKKSNVPGKLIALDRT
jgi:hypothetical protein